MSRQGGPLLTHRVPPKVLSLSEKAYQLTKKMIFSAEILPREPITELGLTAALKMSRTPVREALKQLRNEGLLVSFAKKGYALNIPSIREVKDLYEIRILLESGAARLAAPKTDLKVLQRFKRQFLSYKTTLNASQENNRNGRDSLSDYGSGDLGRAFHFFIIESTGNKKLKKAIEKIYEQIAISRIFAYSPRRKEATEEHLKIVDALIHRNPRRSQFYMEKHLRNGFEVLTEIL